MNRKPTSTQVTLWANRIIFIVVTGLMFFLPKLLDWYAAIRLLSAGQEKAITVAFYCCAAVILLALWCMEKLLKNIIHYEVFTEENVKLIRRVCLCCGLVALICLPAGFIYPPLIFLSVIIGFLCLVVNVVCQVIRAAVSLREENDLTI